LVLLAGVLTAINEGETTIEDEFGPKDKMPKDPVKAKVPEPKPPAEPKAESPAAVIETPRAAPKESIEADFLPGLPKPKPEAVKPAELPPKPPEAPKPVPKIVELDPVYESVRKRMEKARVSLKDLLLVLHNMGLPQPNAKTLGEIRLGAMKMVDNDWQAILDELAMNPDFDEPA
jgi:hypothetical protein